MAIYPLDYTGLSPDNLHIETIQLSAANYRNFFVVIPSGAPYFGGSLVVKDAVTNTVLQEGVHYYKTHEFREASLSIELPIYGSISFIRSTISNDIRVECQVIGGDWQVVETEIAAKLANLIANPRAVRWTQIQQYPNAFPVVNHDINGDTDLIGLSSVVSALNELIVAVGQRNQSTPVSQPSIVAATVPETLAGVIANKATTPLGVKAVADEVKSTLRNEISAARVLSSGVTDGVRKDLTSDTLYLNNARKVSVSGTTFKAQKGISFIDGKKVELAESTVVDATSVPVGIFDKTYFDSTTGSATSNAIEVVPLPKVTNVLTYGNMPLQANWSATNGAITYNQGYDSKLNLQAFKTVFTSAGYLYRYFHSSTVNPGDMVSVSFTLECSVDNITCAVGVGLESRTIAKIDRNQKRYTVTMPASGIPVLSFYFNGACTVLMSEVQVIVNGGLNNSTAFTSTFANAVDNAVWSKTNVTVTADASALGTVPNRFYDKVLETTTAGNHVLSRDITVVKGQYYSATFLLKAEERSRVQLYFNGVGFNYTTEESCIIDLTTGSVVSTTFTGYTPIVIDANLLGTYAPGCYLVKIACLANNSGNGTIGIRTALTNNSVSYAGTATSGYSIGAFIIYYGNNTTTNLLGHVADISNSWQYLTRNATISEYPLPANLASGYSFRLKESIGTSALDTQFGEKHCIEKVTKFLRNTTYTLSGHLQKDTVTNAFVHIYETDANNTTISGEVVITYNLNTNTFNKVENGTYVGKCTTSIATSAEGFSKVVITFTTGANGVGQGSDNLHICVGTVDGLNNIAYASGGNSLIFTGLALEEGTTSGTLTLPSTALVPYVDYIDTYALSRGKYLPIGTLKAGKHGLTNTTYYISNLLAVYVNSTSGKIIDLRNSVYTKEAILKGNVKYYSNVESGDFVAPNVPKILKSGDSVYIKPLAISDEGDRYIFTKENGTDTPPVIYTSGDGDQMVFWSYVTNGTVYDTSVTYNTQGPLEIVVINGKFHVYF